MTQLSIYLGVLVGIFTIVAAIAGLYFQHIRIKHLRLSMEKLEMEIEKLKIELGKRLICLPTPEEKEKYGKAIEQMVVESQNLAKRQNEFTQVLQRQVDAQLEFDSLFEEQSERATRFFDDSADRIRILRERLVDLEKVFSNLGAEDKNNSSEHAYRDPSDI